MFYAFAVWRELIAAPPLANRPAPINVITTTQAFLGGKRLNRATTADVLSLGPGLGVDGVLRGYSNLIVDGNVGIGTTTPAHRLHVAGGDIVITEGGITCPIWRDCDGDGHTPGRGDCDESCPTCFVGSTHFTTAPDGKDQNCNLVVDEFVPPDYFLFDTAVAFTGNIGGRAGADHKCNTDVDKPAVCITAAWAFISVVAGDEIRNMPTTKAVDTTRPWFFRDAGHAGVLAANNWAHLLSGSVANTPMSGGIDGGAYWTGSRWIGSLTSTCYRWTTSTVRMGGHGARARSDFAWLDSYYSMCHQKLNILCACQTLSRFD